MRLLLVKSRDPNTAWHLHEFTSTLNLLNSDKSSPPAPPPQALHPCPHLILIVVVLQSPHAGQEGCSLVAVGVASQVAGRRPGQVLNNQSVEAT
jgi:hypothetical protein